ncbi:hypothetical protein G4B88_000126 [Cannabis sativa]|uniref:Uncharacterized protein n=1 Tax=Cannabis sativa TaxID=3483 RepID=A0A7J6G0H5_CANSA|nr:hypothetical protein G4B88_000126 [Cannabis sativa]
MPIYSLFPSILTLNRRSSKPTARRTPTNQSILSPTPPFHSPNPNWRSFHFIPSVGVDD